MSKRPNPPANQHQRQMPVTHHDVPPEEANRGVLFVVRDEDWENVWGANLTYEKAKQCKERVAGRRLSKTVMFEEMPTDIELLALCLNADEIGKKIVRTPELEEAHRRLNGEPPPAVKAAAEKKRRELEERRRAAALAAKRQQAEAARAAEQDDDEDDDEDMVDELAEELADMPMSELEQ